MYMYPRAKLADLVSLLSGRDFESREFRVDIMEDTYARLKEGVLNVFNKNNFNQFMLAIRGAGFISAKLVNSYMALDFAYALYLRLTRDADVSVSEVKAHRAALVCAVCFDGAIQFLSGKCVL